MIKNSLKLNRISVAIQSNLIYALTHIFRIFISITSQDIFIVFLYNSLYRNKII